MCTWFLKSFSVISQFSEFEQVMRVLQTIVMRVEHQGRQLDAIAKQLSNDTHQISNTDGDIMVQPFMNLDVFEKLDADITSNESMRTRLV